MAFSEKQISRFLGEEFCFLLLARSPSRPSSAPLKKSPEKRKALDEARRCVPQA